jgi:hypothetical protein
VALSNDERLFLRCEAVELSTEDSDSGDDDTSPKWVQIAASGIYAGYKDGAQPFELNLQRFQEAIRNLHAHSSFKAGPDGVGISPVIPWDFHHASEIDPSSGSIAVSGTPAQAWTYDLQVRNGKDGVELWALTSFDEPARTYVKNGQYKWASIALTFDAVDQRSGKRIGAVISSIALTNSPFITGMAELVAEDKPVHAKTTLEWYSKAESPQEALSLIKSMLGLKKTAGIDEVNAELGKIGAWLESGSGPIGVDIRDICSSLRNILNLQALTSDGETIAKAMGSLAALMNESELKPGVAQSAMDTPSAVESGLDGGYNMELLEKIAELLGVPAVEQQVTASVKDLVDLRAEASAALATNASTKEILASASHAVSSASERNVLLEALGATDMQSATAKVAALLSAADEYDKAKPELEELRESRKQAEEAAITSDVDAAMKGHGLPEQLRAALTLQRRTDPERFTADFPKKEVPTAMLTRDVAVTNSGAPLSVTAAAVGQQVQTAGHVAGNGAQQPIDVAAFDGVNLTQKAENAVRSLNLCGPNAKYDTIHRRAVSMKQAGLVFDSSVA